MLTHKIYNIQIEGIPTYIGYTTQDLKTRLSGHLYEATHPTKEKEQLAVIRGKQKLKDELLSRAIHEGLEITINLVEEKPVYEPLDENYWIEYYRNDLGYTLVNRIPGSTWQPYCLVDGELVEVDRESTDVEIRQQIQNFKQIVKNRPKKVKAVSVDPVRLLTDKEKQEMFSYQLSEDLVLGMGSFFHKSSSIR